MNSVAPFIDKTSTMHASDSMPFSFVYFLTFNIFTTAVNNEMPKKIVTMRKLAKPSRQNEKMSALCRCNKNATHEDDGEAFK